LEPSPTATVVTVGAPNPPAALPLKERKVLWMKTVSLHMDADRQADRMGPGRKATWMTKANELYGEDAAMQSSATTRPGSKSCGRAGKAPKTPGRPPEFPAFVMVDLIAFIGLLRAMKLPV
jgi:hypothetical protein